MLKTNLMFLYIKDQNRYLKFSINFSSHFSLKNQQFKKLDHRKQKKIHQFFSVWFLLNMLLGGSSNSNQGKISDRIMLSLNHSM